MVYSSKSINKKRKKKMRTRYLKNQCNDIFGLFLYVRKNSNVFICNFLWKFRKNVKRLKKGKKLADDKVICRICLLLTTILLVYLPTNLHNKSHLSCQGEQKKGDKKETIHGDMTQTHLYIFSQFLLLSIGAYLSSSYMLSMLLEAPFFP